MTYKTYLSALQEKRLWKFFGFHSVIINRPDGWKVKIVAFVGWNLGVAKNG